MAEYNQFTLRQAAQYDFRQGARHQVTGWGMICAKRAEMKTARKYKPNYTKLRGKKVNSW
jgi:hypothetical protein